MKWKSFREKMFNWEHWPFGLRYLAIMPVWLWYCARARSAWFFTPSNPTITFGGFEGEGKKEMYELLPRGTYPQTIYILPGTDFSSVLQKVYSAGFTFPFIVKPDVGMKGLLFRKIDDEESLRRYHSLMPVEYLVQELVNYPLEVSVFYYRYPNKPKGTISGFIQKSPMEIIGDGSSTYEELIKEHPQAKLRWEEMELKHKEVLQNILPAGEHYYLTYAANLNRGAKFQNLDHLIDEQLLQLFDSISEPAQFYYGRYDIKCTSVEDLKKGKNFSILEYNGSGAEPNHVYHAGLSLKAANKIFLQHWKALFEISRYNHKKGIEYWSFKRGYDFLKEARKHFKILEDLDRKIPV